ncbi:MAG: hypothetical protein K9M82_09225 [Deltaproteobacteria bacterium]|nr:hypothetical protein [Deltaproteobacteria bacterium]
MYLKCACRRGRNHYLICESYAAGELWRHRVLKDLGPDPGAWIDYPGGNSFHVREGLEEELRDLGGDVSDDALEALFLPFLDPRIRRIVEQFQRYDPSKKPWKAYSRDELFRRQQSLHDFDKRRLHYLRCGRVDIGNLDARPWPFLNVLIDKSRDEIEAVLEEMERELPPWEIRPYLYTALRCQTRFSHLMTRNQPEALDPERVDAVFLEDLCRLNRDPRFFLGVEDHLPNDLHAYLVRYAILYFDSEFERSAPGRGYVEDFIRKHRFYAPPRRSGGFDEAEKAACRRLGIKPEKLRGMSRRELTRRYRRLAMECHPDRGGESEAFVKLQASYERLLRRTS